MRKRTGCFPAAVYRRRYKMVLFAIATVLITVSGVSVILQKADTVIQETPAVSGIYRFTYLPRGAGSTGSDEVYYSDEFFSEDNSNYSHDLARASLALAMTAFEVESASDFAQALGYETPTLYRYDQSGDEDKAAMVMSHKVYGEKTVLMAAVRGGGYGDEWGSNGRVGFDGETFGYHYGFHESARDSVVQLMEYAADNDIDLGKSAVWITGFSRGAAVANAMGAMMLDEGIVSPEKMFDYTFATPSTVSERLLPEGDDIRGIYNIVNPLDIVTRLPMHARGISQTVKGKTVRYNWDYTKYGTTMELPSENGSAQLQLVELLENAMAFATRNEMRYVEKTQDQVMVPALKRALGKGADISKRNVGYVLVEALPGVTTFLKNELDLLDLKTQLYVAGILSGKKSVRLEREHWPETYWEWMVKTDGLE